MDWSVENDWQETFLRDRNRFSKKQQFSISFSFRFMGMKMENVPFRESTKVNNRKKKQAKEEKKRGYAPRPSKCHDFYPAFYTARHRQPAVQIIQGSIFNSTTMHIFFFPHFVSSPQKKKTLIVKFKKKKKSCVPGKTLFVVRRTTVSSVTGIGGCSRGVLLLPLDLFRLFFFLGWIIMTFEQQFSSGQSTTPSAASPSSSCSSSVITPNPVCVFHQ